LDIPAWDINYREIPARKRRMVAADWGWEWMIVPASEAVLAILVKSGVAIPIGDVTIGYHNMAELRRRD